MPIKYTCWIELPCNSKKYVLDECNSIVLYLSNFESNYYYKSSEPILNLQFMTNPRVNKGPNADNFIIEVK